ncbi:MAG TPA: flagellar biosynthesis protein FlhA [Treponemataceae bacterium]|nr:flagellar biosynthesis protein FlhA [Treponemataceae bacterium]
MAEKVRFKNTVDLFVAVGVIVVVMMLIIPLPTVLLDLLMAVNLLLSFLILLLVIYTPRAIDFSSFPSVLLVSTVFGLGLNVSSTRLILSKGIEFDGRMVRAFSTFVVGTSGTEGVVIGFVIFIILIAVQTFVITKGATRVAEVAARFTLDGMPMKQAGIEAEYNSGAITEEEARKRKMEVQQESDFYGSMDGAAKFVSGNVKVGIFITVINLVVGLIFGIVLRAEDFTTALQTYAVLTIGDGLLSQMPSLLVSFATGLIVTRSASDGKTTLGASFKKEFAQNAWIYYVAGITMAVIGILPGFPWYVLIPMGGALGYLGWRLASIEKLAEQKQLAKEKEKQKTPSSPSGISPVVPLDPLSLELGFAIIPLLDEEKGGDLKERIGRIRRELGLDLGLVVPPIRMIDNIALEPNEYSFKIRGVEVDRGKVRMGWYMCMNTGGVTEEIPGEKTVDPAFGLPAIWITEDNREKAERAGYAVVDPPTIIATHLTEMIKSRAAEILGRQEVQSIIDTLKKDYSAVVEESTKTFTVGEIQKVMQGLLREQVSVRNMVAILETMCDFAPVSKKAEILVEKVRQRLGRQICQQYMDDTKTLHVITIEPSFLERLAASRVDTVNGPIAALEPVDHRNWISSLSASIASVQDKGYMPIILCPEAVRILVKASTEREMPNLIVLSVPEIDKEIRVESLGEIKVG